MYKDNFTEQENTRNQILFEDYQQRLESEVGLWTSWAFALDPLASLYVT